MKSEVERKIEVGEMETAEIDEEMENEILRVEIISAKWVEDRFDELAKKFEGKLIAVEGEEIIASSGDAKDLMKQVERKGKDPRRVYITSFPPKDFILIP